MMPHFDDIRAHFPVSVHTVYAQSENCRTIFNTSNVAKKFAAGKDVELTAANLRDLFIFDSWSTDGHVEVAKKGMVAWFDSNFSNLFRPSVFSFNSNAQIPWDNVHSNGPICSCCIFWTGCPEEG
jgi:hypothetical protein